MTSFYLTVAIKLALGLISLVFVINLTGKGNLAPSSATDQVQNFVLGAILGGTIYSSTVSILQYIVILIIWTILILLLKWLITNILFIKHLIDFLHRPFRNAAICTAYAAAPCFDITALPRELKRGHHIIWVAAF